MPCGSTRSALDLDNTMRLWKNKKKNYLHLD